MAREEEDKQGGISAGRFVHPNLLPPMRNIRIEGAGRGISGGRLVHPGPTGIGIDYENSYHFGEIAAISAQPSGAITDAWVEYQAAPGLAYVRATSIPQGLPCKFNCAGNAISGGNLSWAIVYTVIDLNDPTLFDYHIRSVSELAGRTTFNWTGYPNDYLQNNHNDPWKMPGHDLNLSFRLFAGSFGNGQPDQTPLQNGDPSLYY
jgi:hypothetical protein